MAKVYNTLLGYFLLVSSVLGCDLQAKEVLHIAVASNFKPALKTLLSNGALPQFEIKMSAASSGVLFSQIMHGAPFDIFLSADEERAQALIANQRAAHASLVTYAQGQLALWQPTSPLQGNKMAIANPRFSPYGKAAKAFLEHSFSASFEYVYGSNITHAFQFVDSGNASKGIVAYSSLISAYEKTNNNKYKEYQLLDEKKYPAILQQGVILNSANQQAAQQFMDFLMSESSQQSLVKLGYKIKRHDVTK
ncbi:molybdate ABC transporter substrate-binding protein [Pseudoalteromonas sp. MMG010]|uniref:molybdate ABC transporter substrate-binding protein n=1 Tax=Pseudoalteromonas sp. MMG010 TaxID=2822685 RepID=UPI001B39D87C|nr:molybdate ABC transporter substrate-binding protein [Pseudoalteromonas sp. MMG010]MBQ4832265.1 molybdate ABC transporter substrate-binding protein [Pseudoalteromonas sp. MMG010]